MAAPTTSANMVCQLCQGKGHGAGDCPNRRKRRADGDQCQICNEMGHRADACPQEAGSDDDPAGYGGVASEAPSDCFSCVFCMADHTEECGTIDGGACDMADERKEKLDAIKAAELRKSRRSAAGPPIPSGKGPSASAHKAPAAGAASAAAGGAGQAATIGGPKPEEILKMTPERVAQVELHAICMLPQAWVAWIWSAATGERVNRHDRLIEGLKQKVGLHKPIPASGNIHPLDVERVTKEIMLVSLLVDPAHGTLDVKVRPRIQKAVQFVGLGIIAFRSAREYGWRVVTRALELYTQDSQVDKLWSQSLVAATKTIADASPGGRGRGGGGGRGGRGGRRGGAGGRGRGRDGDGGS